MYDKDLPLSPDPMRVKGVPLQDFPQKSWSYFKESCDFGGIGLWARENGVTFGGESKDLTR
jgi:hypothetical protein